MSVRAATRLEALAVSRYDFNKFVRRNGVVIDSVVEGAMVAPSRKEFTALWENNRQWELYVQHQWCTSWPRELELTCSAAVACGCVQVQAKACETSRE